ncbi:DNA excision repair protein ERCC-1, putative [Pediculus humanus corporis]|uniref:DNA excision repair protein ERCC-1 n=1 Tax=Pediculus humanus subsp. corporis TaxID=121224 RepID=E0V967_PEDHC|nr:DNA excision repair protein ERCC-1, putative [Pediculus humanus corporis]EEB09923.1 DNA excision repair protein ERCC-1, putative [Pediculus humanus corporis]
MSSDNPEPSSSKAAEVPPEPQIHVKASGNAILRGNPLLKYITHVPWEFDDRMLADYVMGQTTCALYLSVRYHNLNPDYIHDRLKILGKNYLLRVLLVMVDIKDPHHAIKTLTRISILANLTIMLCRSSEEAGKIIERYKIYQNKPPDLIMEKKEADPYSRIMSALITIRSINKTDATILLSTYGTLRGILKASENSLSLCPGIGPQKASRLYKTLHESFLKGDLNCRQRFTKSNFLYLKQCHCGISLMLLIIYRDKKNKN